MTPRLFLTLALVAATAASSAAQSRSSTPSDESAIRAARARSNRAIAAHDLDSASAIWSPDYVGVSSGNVRAVGRDQEREHFAQVIASRPNVMFLRTPASIAVNAKWAQAGESGRWTGSWSSPDGVTRVGGIYFSKWRKEGGEWKILAETFVQTSCSGKSYCGNPPAASR